MKCNYGVLNIMGTRGIGFLGYLITAQGISFLSINLQAIINYKIITTVHELRIFPG